ncbi:hypothetical protein ACFLIM_31940 [Nonomuraea sp. M3C6]|uniref:MarR family transcriptional regulator n=1 Tax=Nonomuraea marmarensis TaxID=3351344 RepID=A0ABW7ANZ3_9ACTN
MHENTLSAGVHSRSTSGTRPYRLPVSGRAVLVHVTPQGAAIVDGRRAERVAHLSELAGHLTPAERAAIATALPALARLVELHRQRTAEDENETRRRR